MPRDTCNFRRRDEKEYRVRVNEAANEPRTGHADHLGARSRYPDGPPVAIAVRDPISPNQGLVLRAPCLVSTNQRLSTDAFVPKGSCGGLASSAAVLANDYACSAGVFHAPVRRILRATAPGSGNQAGICSAFAIQAHVDKGWCAGKTDKPCELRDCDFRWSGHGGVHLRRGHGRDVSAEASRGNRGRPPDDKSI
jgi:hypothetical protein